MFIAVDNDGQRRTTTATVLVTNHIVGDQARSYLKQMNETELKTSQNKVNKGCRETTFSPRSQL